MTFNYKVFLASQSPRRRELVKEIFCNVRMLTLVGDEPRWLKTELPGAYLSTCLDFKSGLATDAFNKETQSQTTPSGFLVADTIVVLDKKVLGKPLNPRDAASMLRELSGRTHTVFTGLRLGYRINSQSPIRIEERVVKTKVQFHKLSTAEITSYVKTGSPMDKAGAYGFQDEALKFVARIEGSYLNVVGLPLLELKAAAEKLGWR